MKLFILNKQEFEQSVSNSKGLHVDAFNMLKANVSSGQIPINLHTFDEDGNIVIFDFKSVSGAIYFYTFRSVVYA